MKLLNSVALVVMLCAISTTAVRATTFKVSVPHMVPSELNNASYRAKGTRITLDYDFTYRRAAREQTEVRVARTESSLYVTFAAEQSEALTETQETNGPGVLADDYVAVFLYPQGTQGFQYAFYANPRGARYQTSSENAQYSPHWNAVAIPRANGYEVTLQIPFAAIKGGGGNWRAQFERFNALSNSLYVWAHTDGQTVPSDAAFAGDLGDVRPAEKHSRPAPRFQPYVLGEASARSVNGDTSRTGMDFSLPLSDSTSFVGSLHPDFSNIEIDQQTIVPSSFPRQVNEVRPFFTQSTSSFNYHYYCLICPYTLYTPSITSVADGYAVEGAEGKFTFGTFETTGEQRSDNGESVDYLNSNKERQFGIFLQRVFSNAFGAVDNVNTISMGFTNQHSHILVYANAGYDRNSNVSDSKRAGYFEGGLGYNDATTTLVVARQSIGQFFQPIDGYVAQSDIAGVEGYAGKTWTFAPNARIHDVVFTDYYGRFYNHLGLLSQADQYSNISLDFKDQIGVKVSQGASGVMTADGEFLPFDGNGFTLGYRMAATTPSYVQYTGGKYYHGKLDAWVYLTTIPLNRNLRATLETDEDQYSTSYAGEKSGTQWLERAAFDWQFNRYASLSVGVRRIVGQNLPNAFETPVFSQGDCGLTSYAAGCPVLAGNVSAALHLLFNRNEIYFVYGDPNSLATTPALYAKWIRYIGADKGT